MADAIYVNSTFSIWIRDYGGLCILLYKFRGDFQMANASLPLYFPHSSSGFIYVRFTWQPVVLVNEYSDVQNAPK